MAERYDVFVSYAHADAEEVRRLAENLHQLGLDVFFDEWEVGPGDVLVHGLDRGLRESRNGILAVSPTSLSRPWVQAEYAALMTAAVERGHLLVPVLLADAEMPPLLATRLWIDLRTADGSEYERKVRRLAAALKGERPAPPPRTGELRPRPGTGVRPEGPIVRRLRIERERVALLDGDAVVAEHQPTGVSHATQMRLWDLERGRFAAVPEEAPLLRDASAAAGKRESGRNALLLQIGEALTREVLDGAAGEALLAVVAEAERLNAPLELGLEVESGLGHVPWETLRLPARGDVPDVPGEPLALHPNVRLFRAVAGLGPTPALPVPGPLRILVAIGSPEEQNARGELLDMERELSRILDAVEPARRQSRPAYVRVLNRGTVAAIRDALEATRYHVLHVTCHAGPGVLVLEKEDGSEDRVDADRFCDEALVPGRGVPVVVLAGCATALGVPEKGTGASALPGLARALLEKGVPAVLAMQAPVSDPYATELGNHFYRALATAERADPLDAFCDARRQLELDRQKGAIPADLAEWATPALFLRGPSLPLYDPAAGFEEIVPPPEPRLADHVVVRAVGEFVGRRHEERRILAALRAPGMGGVLLRGLGGAGKSSLAAETLRRLSEQRWLVASQFGVLSPDGLLAEAGRTYLAAFQSEGVPESDPRRQLAVALGRPDLDWEQRFDLLSRILLGERPLIVLLDNFEDNLVQDGGDGEKVRNEDLAVLLSRWLRNPGLTRFLITSRHPFELPDRGHKRLSDLHLGPLSFAETRKLIWRLPGLDALSRLDKLRAYQDVGGHPRALEYLDALLRGGEARFPDVADRMEKALEKKGIRKPDTWMGDHKGNLNRALAETVTLASDDVLLDRLLERLEPLPLAKTLLIGASVYRVPVDLVGLAWQVGEEIEIPGDRERGERLEKIRAEIQQAMEKGERPGGELIEAYQGEMGKWLRPPLDVPEDFEDSRSKLESLGLLAPVEWAGSEEVSRFFVHRWTASAVLQRANPESLKEAHRRAALYWSWRVARVPQDRVEDIEQLLEARIHHYQASELDKAVGLSEAVASQLDTWGAYRREEEICRETLDWLKEDQARTAGWIHQLGIIAQRRGDYTRAFDWYKKSLQVAEELGNRSGMAGSYHQLGRIAQLRGDYSEALDWFTKSLQIAEELGNRSGMARSYHQLGVIAQERGEYTDALDWYKKSLQIKEELSDRSGMARSYHQLGMIAQERGEYSEALDWYKKSLQIAEELGDRSGMASSYHQLGMIAQERGKYYESLDWYKKSLQIKEELGDRSGIANSYGQLGRIAQDCGDYSEALDWCKKSLQIAEELGDRSGMARSISQIGVLLTESGSPEQAVPLNLQSLGIRLQLGVPEIRINLQWLRRQRELLGEERFGEILREHLEGDAVQAVLEMMEQAASTGPSEPA